MKFNIEYNGVEILEGVKISKLSPLSKKLLEVRKLNNPLAIFHITSNGKYEIDEKEQIDLENWESIEDKMRSEGKMTGDPINDDIRLRYQIIRCLNEFASYENPTGYMILQQKDDSSYLLGGFYIFTSIISDKKTGLPEPGEPKSSFYMISYKTADWTDLPNNAPDVELLVIRGDDYTIDGEDRKSFSTSGYPSDIALFSYIIWVVLKSISDAHAFHLITSSYAAHMALQTYYESMPEKVDALAEHFQECYSLDPECMRDGIDRTECPIQYFEEVSNTLTSVDIKVINDSQIQSLYDDVVNEVTSLLYKLKKLN